MCQDFKIHPHKSLSRNEYLNLVEKCGEPYPELAVKDVSTTLSKMTPDEYKINKHILGIYHESDQLKNYYPSYFLFNLKSVYNPTSLIFKTQQAQKTLPYSLVDLNLNTVTPELPVKRVYDEIEINDFYPTTNPIKYHPLTQIPEKKVTDGTIVSFVKSFFVEKPIEPILYFSQPKASKIKDLFEELPYKLFERRQKSLLIRQELRSLTTLTDLCSKTAVMLNETKFTLVKSTPSHNNSDIYVMINDAMNRSFMPNGRYCSGSIVCKDFMAHAQENIDATLETELPNLTTDLKSTLLCQLLLTLTVLQGQYGILHKNITAANIGLIKIKKNNKYFKYVIAGRTFYLPNIGYIAMFLKFDDAVILNPLYTVEQYYGIRNLKISSDIEPLWGNKAKYELTITPITTKYLPILDAQYKYKSYKYNNTLQNIFIENFNSGPSETLDLTDMRTYPALDFKQDIENLLRIFITKKYLLDDVRSVLPDIMAATLFPEFQVLQFDLVEAFKWP